MSPRDAYRHMTSGRSLVRPNLGFWRTTQKQSSHRRIHISPIGSSSYQRWSRYRSLLELLQSHSLSLFPLFAYRYDIVISASLYVYFLLSIRRLDDITIKVRTKIILFYLFFLFQPPQ
ncbi:hypothetical protein Tcan_17510 [Toxocara canis]|uniref:Uncharacterized protein n=1 Tax=Toxocara canis TaxID=6265 RepID=A0A0B2VAZ8_TOXCA|nr:hypothetical protein Tcan_17510 [Toxocara canis]